MRKKRESQHEAIQLMYEALDILDETDNPAALWLRYAIDIAAGRPVPDPDDTGPLGTMDKANFVKVAND